MNVRGVRGAIDVPQNDAGEILKATRELLQEMAERNSISSDTIAAVYFSTTPDLNATFPAAAARQLGWASVPLFSSLEIDVPEALPRCIRILILFNTAKTQEEIHHIYLRGAITLRPDLT